MPESHLFCSNKLHIRIKIILVKYLKPNIGAGMAESFNEFENMNFDSNEDFAWTFNRSFEALRNRQALAKAIVYIAGENDGYTSPSHFLPFLSYELQERYLRDIHIKHPYAKPDNITPEENFMLSKLQWVILPISLDRVRPPLFEIYEEAYRLTWDGILEYDKVLDEFQDTNEFYGTRVFSDTYYNLRSN